ncbi:hypothetical protein BG011_009034 [Mortierella polycephala]|uniref:Uncharacterized protein n=1 Tax=Mortierella polycephala TaxID=41804 RepID=A0A9P6PLY1_9FUNG|nr:hypothetical protein BG011_009034 [Mortierella polycephala]
MNNDIFSDILDSDITNPKTGIDFSDVCNPLAWRGSELECPILDSFFSSPSHASFGSSDASETTLENDFDMSPIASPAGADADQSITSEMRFIDELFDSSAFHDLPTTSSSSAIPENINQPSSQLPCASPNNSPLPEYSLFGAPIDALLLKTPSHIPSPKDLISANTLQSANNGLNLFPLYGSDLPQYHSPASTIDPGHLPFGSLSNANDMAVKVLAWMPSLQINMLSAPAESSIEWPVLETTPASNYLKLRQTEIEHRIEFPTSPSAMSSDGDRNGSDCNNNHEQRNEVSHGGLTDMPFEDSFNWKEFEQLYYESDLFKWHRDNYLGVDRTLDIEDMKRVWIENEILYEKAFVETARRRIAQEGSRNAKKKKEA